VCSVYIHPKRALTVVLEYPRDSARNKLKESALWNELRRLTLRSAAIEYMLSVGLNDKDFSFSNLRRN
jgi:hypothetical protein